MREGIMRSEFRIRLDMLRVEVRGVLLCLDFLAYAVALFVVVPALTVAGPAARLWLTTRSHARVERCHRRGEEIAEEWERLRAEIRALPPR
jgi:hypothetical protein